jgi:4,5-DOPA dioxygenase extradiol
VQTNIPAIFISHGAPTLAIETSEYQQDLREFAKNIERPSAILTVSAHWEQNRPLLITASDHPKTIHDFWGFPQELYEIQYNAPGNPQLARKIALELTKSGFPTEPTQERGIDHGTWVPLSIMYPKATIPVLQLSIPTPRSRRDLFRLGQILSRFREENIMILGSGGVVHNLRLAMPNFRRGNKRIKPDPWAVKFDQWVKEKLETQSFEDLLEAQNKAPEFRKAAPTSEHFDPIALIIGTARGKEGIVTIHESIEYGNLSLRSFATEA